MNSSTACALSIGAFGLGSAGTAAFGIRNFLPGGPTEGRMATRDPRDLRNSWSPPGVEALSLYGSPMVSIHRLIVLSMDGLIIIGILSFK